MTTNTMRNTILVACCLLTFSCQDGPYRAPAVQAEQFQDVVVPDGFRIRDRYHESYSKVVDSWRHGHWIYTGKASVDEASAFVMRSTPRHSWQKVSEQALDEDGKRLRFERGVYTADYTFRRQDGVTQMVVDYSTDYSRR